MLGLDTSQDTSEGVEPPEMSPEEFSDWLLRETRDLDDDQFVNM